MKTTIQEIFREVYPGLSLAQSRCSSSLSGFRFNGEEVTHMDQEVDLKDGDTFQRGKRIGDTVQRDKCILIRDGNEWVRSEQMEDRHTQYLMDLVDEHHESPNPASVKVKIRHSGNDNMLLIGAKGYGEMTAMDGGGYPILLEYHEGELRLMVWADINQEEPTHVISLEGAREDAREG